MQSTKNNGDNIILNVRQYLISESYLQIIRIHIVAYLRHIRIVGHFTDRLKPHLNIFSLHNYLVMILQLAKCRFSIGKRFTLGVIKRIKTIDRHHYNLWCLMLFYFYNILAEN